MAYVMTAPTGLNVTLMVGIAVCPQLSTSTVLIVSAKNMDTATPMKTTVMAKFAYQYSLTGLEMAIVIQKTTIQAVITMAMTVAWKKLPTTFVMKGAFVIWMALNIQQHAMTLNFTSKLGTDIVKTS